jgi:hypothetical protein
MTSSISRLVQRESLRHFLAVLAWVLACTMAATLAFAATTQATFSRTDLPILGNIHIAADFNGDGKLDLAGAGGTAVKVQLGQGDGTFAAAVSFPVPGSSQSLAAGDFNGDGRIDLAVTINDPAIGLALLLGNGDGTFQAPVAFANTAGFDAPTIVAVDLDNDGRLDVVIGHQIACFTAPCRVATVLTVLLGNGDGTFQPARLVDIGTETAMLAVGDFNRDGIKDLAVASSRARLLILLGVGNGTFNQQPTLTLIAGNNLGMDATDVDVADFNRDGIDDLAVAVALNGSRTAVLTGNGDGTFRMPPLLITEPNLNVPQYQAVGDFNGDGFPDLALALANGTNGLFEILNGNGDGTFQPPTFYFAPPPLSSRGGIWLIAAQLTANARPDLVLVVGGAAANTSVFINTSGAAPPTPPAAPALLAPANDATPSQPVTFDWSDVANATGYEIQVDDSSTFSAPFRASQAVTVSQATITGLPAQRLWWRVRAKNAAGVFGPFSAARRFTPRAVATPAVLSAIAAAPPSVVGGTAAQGTVTLSGAAPAGGALVTLSSSNAVAVMLPPNVTVAPGATNATFAITTTAVAASTLVTLSGTFGDATRGATLTVQPAGQPPAPAAVLTLSASGRSGERIVSSPAGLNVPVGSSGQASFATGPAITLSATNGRDVVWSGACSSGGNKSRTCTFTINANAAVTGIVQ